MFICSCNSHEHQADFHTIDGELYVTIHLTTHKSFFKRLISGIKYVFGYKSRFGAFDEFIFKEKELNSLALHLFSEEDRYTIHNALGTQYTFLENRGKYVRDMDGYESDKQEAYNVKRLQNVFHNSNQDFWNEHEMVNVKPYGKFLF